MRLIGSFLKSDRWKTVGRNLAGNVVVRGVVATSNLLQVPIVINHLDAEAFGLWSLLTSVTMLFTITDLGIGNSLQMQAGTLFGQGRRQECGALVESAMRVLIAIMGLVSFLGLVAYFHAELLARILGVEIESEGELRMALPAAIICYAASVPGACLGRVCVAIGRGLEFNIIQSVAQIVALGSVVAWTKINHNISGLVVASTLPAVILSTMGAIVLTRREGIRAGATEVSWRQGWSVTKLGIFYLVPQLVSMLMLSLPQIILSRYLSLIEVAQYNVVTRVFGFLSAPLAMITNSIGATMAVAMGERDYEWMRKVFWKFMFGGICFGLLASGAGFIASQYGAFQMMTRGEVAVPSTFFLLGFAAWAAVSSLGATLGSYLNNVGRPHLQGIYSGVFILIIGLSLGPGIQQFGASAVPWLLAGIYILVVAPALLWDCLRFLNQIKHAPA